MRLCARFAIEDPDAMAIMHHVACEGRGEGGGRGKGEGRGREREKDGEKGEKRVVHEKVLKMCIESAEESQFPG